MNLLQVSNTLSGPLPTDAMMYLASNGTDYKYNLATALSGMERTPYTDDWSTGATDLINTEIEALTYRDNVLSENGNDPLPVMVGGGVVKLPPSMIIPIDKPIVLRTGVMLDLNRSILQWVGGSAGVMIDTPDTEIVTFAGVKNGFFDLGDSANNCCAYGLRLRGVISCYFGHLGLIRCRYGYGIFLSIGASTGTDHYGISWSRMCTFENLQTYVRGQRCPVPSEAIHIHGGTTDCEFIGPFYFFARDVGYHIERTTGELCNDALMFSGRHMIKLSWEIDVGIGLKIIGDATTNSTDTKTYYFDYFNATNMWWNNNGYHKSAGNSCLIELTNVGGLTIDQMLLELDNVDGTGVYGQYVLKDNNAISYEIHAQSYDGKYINYIKNVPARFAVATTPPSGSTGVTNEIRLDSNYIYVKTAAGWKRAALSAY